MDFLKYYFYKNDDFKNYSDLSEINIQIMRIVSKYSDDLEERHEKISELLPYGLDDYREYFASKAARDFSPSYFNVFYWIKAILFAFIMIITKVVYLFLRKK